MPKNILFNFLEASKNLHIKNCTAIKKTQDKKQTNYYRLELKHAPIVINGTNQTFTSEAHHISVYETENQHNPLRSQYHYTIYFKNQYNERYRLHVYFDGIDSLTTKPIFEKEDHQGKYIPCPTDVSDEQFIQLAIAQSIPIINDLRKRLTQTIELLEADYVVQEQQASTLSRSVIDDENTPKSQKNGQQKYLSQLTKIAQILKNLAPLVNQDYYTKTLKFINELIFIVKQSPPKSAKLEKPETRTSSKTKQSKPTKDDSFLEQHSLFKPSKAANKNKTINLESELSIINKTLLVIANKSAPEQIDPLLKLYLKIYSLPGILTFDESAKASLNSLQKLKEIHQTTYNRGKELLLILLEKKEFNLAQKLTPFFTVLNKELLSQALENGNAELLDFILTNCNFAIDDLSLKIDNKNYPSAVHYCYLQNTKNIPLKDCLAVLIKHGAPTLVKHKNLPIAHLILSDEENPLAEAFKTNNQYVFLTKDFYQRLINELKAVSENTQIDRLTLDKAIKHYESEMDKLVVYANVSNSRQKILANQSQEIEDSIDKELIKRLNEDPEFQQVQTYYKNLSKDVSQLFSSDQQRQAAIINSRLGKNYNEIKHLLPKKQCSFEEYKQQAIAQLKEHIKYTLYQKEQLNTAQELQVARGKKQHKLIAKYQELDKTVKRLGKGTILLSAPNAGRHIKEALKSNEQLERKTDTHKVKNLLQHSELFNQSESAIKKHIQLTKDDSELQSFDDSWSCGL